MKGNFSLINNLIPTKNEPTYFKNPEDRISVDLTMTNRPTNFLNLCTIERVL